MFSPPPIPTHTHTNTFPDLIFLLWQPSLEAQPSLEWSSRRACVSAKSWAPLSATITRAVELELYKPGARPVETCIGLMHLANALGQTQQSQLKPASCETAHDDEPSPHRRVVDLPPSITIAGAFNLDVNQKIQNCPALQDLAVSTNPTR